MPSFSLGIGVVGLLLIFASLGILTFALVAGVFVALFGILFGWSDIRRRRHTRMAAVGVGINALVLLLCISALALHLTPLPIH